MGNKFKRCDNCNKKVLNLYIKKYINDGLCPKCFKSRLINNTLNK